MTDLVFYQEMDQLALELLTEFGSPATARLVVKSKPNDQGVVTKQNQDTPGLAVRTESKAVLDAFTKPATVALVVKFPTEPAVESLIVHAGQTWKILEFKAVNPLGTNMIIGFASCVRP